MTWPSQCPTESLLAEAAASPNPHYLEDLKERRKELPPTRPQCRDFDPEDEYDLLVRDKEPTTISLYPDLHPNYFTNSFPSGIYSGTKADAAYVDLFISSPDTLVNKAVAYEVPYDLYSDN